MGKMKHYFVEDVVVFALRSVAPLSLIYTIYRIGLVVGCTAASWSSPPSSKVVAHLYTLPWPLEIFIYLETAFFLYLSWRTVMLGKRSSAPRISREERSVVLERCLAHTDDMKEWISGWFFDEPYDKLSAQDLRNFAAFMFFSRYPREIPEGSEDAVEIEEIVEKMQAATGTRLPDKHPDGKEHLCMRHTIDPLRAKHRPVVVYLLTYTLDFINAISLRCKGFRRGAIGRVAYWYRPASRQGAVADGENRPTPVVFVHGIGAGLFLYQTLVSQLVREVTTDVFLVELPHASLRLRADVPGAHEGVKALKSMLAKQQHSKAIFAGHSLGSIYISWMCRFSPETVVGSVFIEPIVFLLHLKTVTRSFLYQDYGGVVGYLIRSELFLNHALRRAFWWYLNVLFIEDVRHESAIYLCENDEVVPTQAVVDYLRRHDQGRHLSCYIMENEFHGKWLFEQETIEQLCGTIARLHEKVSPADVPPSESQGVQVEVVPFEEEKKDQAGDDYGLPCKTGAKLAIASVDKAKTTLHNGSPSTRVKMLV